MNRVGAGGQGRERLAGVVPGGRARRGMAELAELLGRVKSEHRSTGNSGRSLIRRVERRCLGWGVVPAGRPSTTARRWARLQAPRRRSIPCRRSWAWLTRRRRPGARRDRLWNRRGNISSVEDEGLVLLFDPPFDKIGADRPATSRAIRRGCARTAASTPMPPCGWRWPWRAVGTDGAPSRSCACSTRSSTPATSTGSGATGSNRTSSRRTSTTLPGRDRAGRLVVVHRLGGLDVPGLGGGGARVEGARRDSCASIPSSRRSGRGSASPIRHGEAVYEIQVENPGHVTARRRLGAAGWPSNRGRGDPA